MELKEAIEKLGAFNLANIIEIITQEEFENVKVAIDTVLNELDNRNKRIYKLENDIEFIINKIVDKAKIYQYYTEITAGTNIETNIRQRTLTELLEEIKKEI